MVRRLCFWLIRLNLAVEKKFPGDRERLARMSLIEGMRTLTSFRQHPKRKNFRGNPAEHPHGKPRLHWYVHSYFMPLLSALTTLQAATR